MRKILLLSSLFLCLLSLGCSAHSSRHANPHRIQGCRLFPCGGEADYPDMVINYEIVRETTTDYIITGTATLLNGPRDREIELALLDFGLTREGTVFDSYSVPMIGRDLRTPLRFKHRFTPESEFDGVLFDWDIHFTD
ncbi:hypothetical protein GM415_00120 [Pseudodesulfovibrio cashew]|uniref:Lipoprotein n=1 Tax=Pseudodesulfovibrio cashew TaxID=2678688 RepID=A0A6I6JLL2_9BACT|nr:hypothetical protein [Pseudodesulfovibrio cashew]QGY38614.1 hypothetical protein GM415_00120 [Pseudodesulfovibrio cashew]